MSEDEKLLLSGFTPEYMAQFQRDFEARFMALLLAEPEAQAILRKHADTTALATALN